RSNSNLLHQKMRAKLGKKAIFVGFTGTPILAGADSNTKVTTSIFGDYIDKYQINDAINDGTVLNLYYTSKKVDLELNDRDKLDKEIRELTSNSDEKSYNKKFTSVRRLLETDAAYKSIADDVYSELKKNYINDGFNCMFATSSKGIAAKYYNYFSENYKDINVMFSISENNTDVKNKISNDQVEKREVIDEIDKALSNQAQKYNVRTNNYETKLIEKFKEGEIDLLIVVDKYLTGFDSPKTRGLFVAKPMKDHNLLQAIARVNRISENKNSGIIVDYVGILENLKKSMKNYTSSQDSLDNFISNLDDLFESMIDYNNRLELMFDNKHDSIVTKEFLTKYIGEVSKRERFYKLYKELESKLSQLNFLDYSNSKKNYTKEFNKIVKNYKIFKEIWETAISLFGNKKDKYISDEKVASVVNKYVDAGQEIKVKKVNLKITDSSFFENLKNTDKSITQDIVRSAALIYIESLKLTDIGKSQKISEIINRIIEEYINGEASFKELEDRIRLLITNEDNVNSRMSLSTLLVDGLYSFLGNLNYLPKSIEILADKLKLTLFSSNIRLSTSINDSKKESLKLELFKAMSNVDKELDTSLDIGIEMKEEIANYIVNNEKVIELLNKEY
ncbi:MAG: type I restriction endonuclease subunit R, partial [Mycoplasmataceae bacterium]|nr:type I restriction endonuclease subunit R [Mycoplasmataceae bacterium]